MRYHTIALLLVCCTLGCAYDPPGSAIPASTKESRRRDASAPPAGALTVGQPVFRGGSVVILIPLELPLEAVSKFGLSGGMSVSYSGGSVSAIEKGFHLLTSNWANAIIVNRPTGDSQLLLHRRALITQMIWQDDQPKQAGPTSYQLFVIADADTNDDKEISPADAAVLYWTSLPKAELIPLTPPGAQFAGLTSDPDSERLYLRVIHDSNGDKRFDARDRANWLVVDPAKPGLGQSLYSPHLIDQAARLISP